MKFQSIFFLILACTSAAKEMWRAEYMIESKGQFEIMIPREAQSSLTYISTITPDKFVINSVVLWNRQVENPNANLYHTRYSLFGAASVTITANAPGFIILWSEKAQLYRFSDDAPITYLNGRKANTNIEEDEDPFLHLSL